MTVPEPLKGRVEAVAALKPTQSINDPEQREIVGALAAYLGRRLQVEILEKPDNDGFVARAAGTLMRMNLRATVVVGERLEMTLNSLNPRPEFAFEPAQADRTPENREPRPSGARPSSAQSTPAGGKPEQSVRLPDKSGNFQIPAASGPASIASARVSGTEIPGSWPVSAQSAYLSSSALFANKATAIAGVALQQLFAVGDVPEPAGCQDPAD